MDDHLAALYQAYADAWMRDDREGAMAFWSDDIVMTAPGRWLGGTYRGKAAVQEQLIDRIFRETSRAVVLGLDDVAIGRSHVFVVAHERFEKSDGRVFETHRVLVYRWRDDQIVEVGYHDPDEAASEAFWAD